MLAGMLGCGTAPEPDPDPIEMRGGMAENAFADIRFAGSGLTRFEGRMVTIRVGGPVPIYFPRERTAVGRAPVSGGAFRLEFPRAREVDLYKPFGLFFDVDGDGKCTPGIDEGYLGATGGGSDTYVFDLAEFLVSPMTLQGCGFLDGPWMD